MGPAGNARRAARMARRLYPLAIAAYRRWDRLSPQEKERYKHQARQYAEQSAHYARLAVSELTKRAPGGDSRGRRR
jgi:hypothetical protein